MMKKKQYLNFGFRKNKKAIIFTLDIAVALIVVFTLLLTASFFITRNAQDPYPTLQLIRTGSDIVRLMEYKGLFDSIDEQQISDYLNDTLPSRFEMKIEGSSSPACEFEVGNDPAADKTVLSAKEFFTTNGEYCSLRYKIWLK